MVRGLKMRNTVALVTDEEVVEIDWSDKGSGARAKVGEGPVPSLPSLTVPVEAPPVPPAEAQPSLTETLDKELVRLSNLLRWADHCLAGQVETMMDVESMRSRARFVLEEARDLVMRCRDEIEAAKIPEL